MNTDANTDTNEDVNTDTNTAVNADANTDGNTHKTYKANKTTYIPNDRCYIEGGFGR